MLYAERVIQSTKRRGAGRYAAMTRSLRIPEGRWSEVAERARSEALRSIARDFGVSHETVRTVLRMADRASR